MAAPPGALQFRKTDFPTTGLGSQDAIDKFFIQLNPFIRATVQALGGGLTLGQNSNAEIKTVEVTTPATDWTAATLSTGWSNLGGDADAQFRKDSTGEVFIEGSVVSASTGFALTLPSGFTPEKEIDFATSVNTAGTRQWALLRVLPTGEAGIFQNAPSGWGELNCSFICADRSPGVMSCFPLTVSTKVQTPKMVFVGNVIDKSTKPQTIALGQPHWTNTDKGIQINNIPGLLIGKTYSVSFLILGG